MANSISATSAFFRKPMPVKTNTGVVEQLTQKPLLFDVGSIGGDDVFRAVAAAFIDKVITRPKTNQILLSTVLAKYALYFPLPKAMERLLTPSERFEKMIASPVGLATFIANLAYTFRQVAVDELCANPQFYRGAFIENNEQTSPENMRKSSTWIDKSALAALSKVLSMPISINVVEEGKELPMQLHHGLKEGAEAGNKIILQLQHMRYIPKILNVARFEASLAQAPRPMEPLIVEKYDPKLDDILLRIKEEDKLLVHLFDVNFHRLTTMVQNGEVSKNELLGIYIKGMEKNNNLQGQVKHAAIEHGHQRFFEEAIRNTKRPISVIGLVKGNHDEQITKELVHALARAISIGHLDEDKIFSELESLQESQKQRNR